MFLKVILKIFICRANWKKQNFWLVKFFFFSQKNAVFTGEMIFFSVEPNDKTFFFTEQSEIVFSEKVEISQNCILTLFSTFQLFFSAFILKIKNFLTFFVSYKKWISLGSIHEKNNFLTCIVTSCKMYFFMHQADWKHFFTAETFFMGEFYFFSHVEPSEKHFYFFFLPVYVFSDGTDWERGSDTQQTAPGQDLNPGLLQWGQSLCAWDETEPRIILILNQKLLNRISRICPSCT